MFKELFNKLFSKKCLVCKRPHANNTLELAPSRIKGKFYKIIVDVYVTLFWFTFGVAPLILIHFTNVKIPILITVVYVLLWLVFCIRKTIISSREDNFYTMDG